MTRISIWRWLSQGVPEYQILPPWLIACQFVLFPRRALLWTLNQQCGFNPLTCCYTIHGVKMSDLLLMELAQPRPGVLYRFERELDAPVVTIRVILLPAGEVQPTSTNEAP